MLRPIGYSFVVLLLALVIWGGVFLHTPQADWQEGRHLSGWWVLLAYYLASTVITISHHYCGGHWFQCVVDYADKKAAMHSLLLFVICPMPWLYLVMCPICKERFKTRGQEVTDHWE